MELIDQHHFRRLRRPCLIGWMHGLSHGSTVDHSSEAVSAERLTGGLTARDEAKWHGLLQPVESFA